ncbi:MAG: hypothetical protein ABSA31_09165 [Acidimicrobiales bacterium]
MCFVALQLGGSTALINSCLGHRVGLWNPALPRFATAGNSPFTPLDAPGTSNESLCCSGSAGHVHEVGSGLGSPDLAKLARDIAHESGSGEPMFGAGSVGLSSVARPPVVGPHAIFPDRAGLMAHPGRPGAR